MDMWPWGNFMLTILLFLGVRRWKNVLCEDSRTMGGVGHIRWCTEDKGPVQGQRHPRQQRDAHELAVDPFPSAGAHHAPWARLFHSSFQQEQVWFLPDWWQRDVLSSFYPQQDSKDVQFTLSTFKLLCFSRLNPGFQSDFLSVHRFTTSYLAVPTPMTNVETETRRESNVYWTTAPTLLLFPYMMWASFFKLLTDLIPSLSHSHSSLDVASQGWFTQQ